MAITWEQIDRWVQLSGTLKNNKDNEGILRREICKEIFGDKVGKFTEKQLLDLVPPGQPHTLHLELVGKSVTSLKMDEAVLQELKNKGKLSEAAEACFVRKLEIKEGPLRKIPKDDPVWAAITESPGMPTLEVKVLKNED